MGARREQRSKREPQTDSAYQPSLHLLLLPSLSEHFFPHRLQPLLSSHLSYRRIKCGHFKVLPHTRVPGACVFSLFKMEWPNPSLAVCDGNGNYEEYLCICVFMWRHRHVSVIMRALDDCVTLLKCLSNVLVYTEWAMHWFYQQRTQTIGTVTNVGSHNKVVLAECLPLLMHVGQ